MEKYELNYSLKNIPCPNNTAYEKALISKTENFLKRMRWKAFFFENNDAPEDKSKQNFGFKTANTPPQNPELVEFEEGIYKIIVEADKTNNIYLVDAAEYKKLIKDNITQSYKKFDINEKFMIDQKSAILSKKT